MSPEVPRCELRPGYSISRLVHGGWQLAQGHSQRQIDRRRILDHLEQLVDLGFTTFDCADIYTGVEELLGELVARLGRRGVPRERVQIHTKLVPDLAQLAALRRADVVAIVDRSLARLGVDVLDLVQFHWWDYAIPGFVEAATWLDDLRREGKIRHLGVTNFDPEHLAMIVAAGVEVVSHQCQYSLLDRRPAPRLAPYCAEHGIHLLAYGTLAGGFLSERWRGRPAPTELENRSLVKYALIVEELGGWAVFQQLLDVLHEVAAHHRVTPSAVAVRWALDRPGVAAAIVGVRSAEHLASARQLFEVALEAEERAQIEAVLAQARGPAGEVYGLERVPGGRHAVIMKTNLHRAAHA